MTCSWCVVLPVELLNVTVAAADLAVALGIRLATVSSASGSSGNNSSISTASNTSANSGMIFNCCAFVGQC